MAKLSENQVAAVAALKKACATERVAYVSKTVWKRYTDLGVKIGIDPLVTHGAIETLKIGVREGSPTDVYRAC